MAIRIVRESAAADGHRQHQLTSDPAEADAILYVESHTDNSRAGLYFENLREDPVFRRWRSKCYVYSGLDFPVATMPGIYTSLRRRWCSRGWAVGGCYIVEPNPRIAQQRPVPMGDRDILASFIGVARRKPLRLDLCRLHGLDGIYAEDTSDAFIGALQRGDEATVERLKDHFAQIAMRSKFILCPAGFAPSSIRLFEAMESGIAPVIIADDWAPPPGPDWDAFSIRAPERRLAELPRVLREREHAATAMGEAARIAWERFYSPRSLFNTLADSCIAIRREQSFPRVFYRSAAALQFLTPLHLRRAWNSLRTRPAPHAAPVHA